MKRYGVIDLGTNTFHLLIAEICPDDSIQEVYRERIFVKLAEDGIEKIGPRPFARGLAALDQFSGLLTEYSVDKVAAIGTAALRTAQNGPDFVQEVNDRTGLSITPISGDEEAKLIYQGVRATGALDEDLGLVMDIGGGSVEFILANKDQIHWAASFPVGVAVLYRLFHREDPISRRELEELDVFLTEKLLPLQQAIQQTNPAFLVGSAGTFDVLADLFAYERPNAYCARLTASSSRQFLNSVQSTSLAGRRSRDDIPLARADMIVVAMLLINKVLSLSKIEEIIVSNYSLKEGVLLAMHEGKAKYG